MNKKDKKNKSEKSVRNVAIFFLSPAIIMLLIWFVYPLIQAFIISFYDFNYMFKEQAVFVGIDNYLKIFKDRDFYRALTNTFAFVIFVVPIQTIISMLLAVLINQKIRARTFFRTSFYLPYVISAVAVATVFMYIFVKDTIVTQFFANFGVDNITWFADVKLALPFIALLYVWQTVGFYMIYFLSGLQTIPSSLYEAAKMDGATKTQQFLFVTVPQLKPITFLVLTYGTIQAFQLYDQIAVVTSRSGGLGSPAGATSTLMTYFYKTSFNYYEMGYGAAIAMIIFIIIMIVTIAQRKFTKMED